jgi:hypothetical protein
MPFMPPLLEDTLGPAGEHISISRIVLSADDTVSFRAAAKRHGATVTQVFNALLALADLETTLRLTTSGDADVYEKTAAAYDQATHVLFAFYFISHVRPQTASAYWSAQLKHTPIAPQAPGNASQPRWESCYAAVRHRRHADDV